MGAEVSQLDNPDIAIKNTSVIKMPPIVDKSMSVPSSSKKVPYFNFNLQMCI